MRTHTRNLARVRALTPKHAVCLFLALLLGGAAAAFASAPHTGRHARGLLWKIEADGPSPPPPSHLFGTIHLADPRVTNLPPPVRQAFEQAASFTTETFFNGAGLIHMAESMFFNDGRSLRRLLGEKDFRLLEQALRRRGLPLGDLDRKKPWAALLALSSPPRHGLLFLDLQLLWQASLAGKPHYPLETMEEQIAVFDGMSLEDQVVLLKETLRQHWRMHEQYELLVQAYLARDLERLMDIVHAARPAQAHVFDRLLERLFTQRHRRMLERMLPRLHEGNAFIAVGAGHLPGEHGLLRLLERQGWRVTPVY